VCPPASTYKTYCLTSSKILFDIIKDTVWHPQRYCLTSSKILFDILRDDEMTIKNKFLLRQATKVERVLYGNKYEECEYLLRTRTILVATPQVRRNSTVEAANSPCQGCRQPLLRLLTAPVCPSDRGCLLPNQPLFASMFKVLLEKRGGHVGGT